MSRRRPSKRGNIARAPALALVLLAGAAVAGCTSMLSRTPFIGEPDTLPARPETTAPFPAVHDLPGPRDKKRLTEEERKKLEAELAAARDKQEADTNTVPAKPGAPAPAPAATPATPPGQ